MDAFTELWSLSERIGALWQEAQGKPVRRRLPSIEAAEKAAGVTAKGKARAAEAAKQRQRTARARRGS